MSSTSSAVTTSYGPARSTSESVRIGIPCARAVSAIDPLRIRRLEPAWLAIPHQTAVAASVVEPCVCGDNECIKRTMRSTPSIRKAAPFDPAAPARRRSRAADRRPSRDSRLHRRRPLPYWSATNANPTRRSVSNGTRAGEAARFFRRPHALLSRRRGTRSFRRDQMPTIRWRTQEPSVRTPRARQVEQQEDAQAQNFRRHDWGQQRERYRQES